MKVRIVTASAGSGKTTHLSRILRDELVAGRARPEGIVATTFTNQAAAELIERARSALLDAGRARDAHALLAARIGTVNAVCGSLVADYAFELGLSPRLTVLDEAAGERALKHALAMVSDDATSAELQDFRNIFDVKLDWHVELRRLIEAARANGIDAEALRACAERSITTLQECLGPADADGDALDRALLAALDGTLAAIDPAHDGTKGTAKYVQGLAECRQGLVEGRLRWGDWAKLVKDRPTKASLAHAEPVADAAAAHARHPRLRNDLQRMIALVYDTAARAMEAYQIHKRELGVIDFVDQETFALQLLRRDDVRADLAGQLDLVLVDEFQDTSPLQLSIFLALAEVARESVWVGDPKQAIFGFRGTDPKLMDAAIESLTAPTHDAELIDRAVDAVARSGTLETLAVSYRSRPELVHLTSDLFVPPFAAQGMPEERVRLRPERDEEPAGLGPVVEHWPFQVGGPAGKELFAACTAAGVRELIAQGTMVRVRDRGTNAPRAARASDVAVLCRTNDQCQAVADALAAQGIAVVVPRTGLLDTREGRLALEGLRLWVDPRDGLAAATIARLTTLADDSAGLVARALAEPGGVAFTREPAVERILAAREAAPDLGVVAALSAIVDAGGLRELCAAWGNSEQRLANLDAIRAHAARYASEAAAAGDAPTVVGLLGRLHELTDDWGLYAVRTDSQALLGGENAVTVSTWHRAKGLEWPLVVLFGLETLRAPLAYGVHVMSDGREFDVADPLAGRWIRFWPNPYTTSNQQGPVKSAYESGPDFQVLRERADREALRVLYVGWTRARDRLILAAKAGKLTDGLLGMLGDPTPIADPGMTTEGEHEVTWAERRLRLVVRPVTPAEPVPAPPAPGRVTVGLPPRDHPPARRLPSAVPPVVCTVGEPVVIGPRIATDGAPDMERVGVAVHAFLAADRQAWSDDERLAVARGLLERYDLSQHLAAEDVAGTAVNLRRWLAHVGATRVHREWPLAQRLACGTVVQGVADLLARTPAGFVLVDHKTFPGTLDAALERLPSYSGQLSAYASAVAQGTGERVTSAWIHLPVLGAITAIQFDVA